VKKFVLSCTFAVGTLTIFGCASTTKPGIVGISRQQLLLVPASTVEQAALANYTQQALKAKDAGRLVSGPEYGRLLRIATRVQAQVPVFREDTAQWKWELILIDAPTTINATCAPGGKITFYTGIIRKLELNDDEIAAVMGHEIAHALREHGRERMSQALASNVLTQAAFMRSNNAQANTAMANEVSKYLFLLPNSRENESEADKIGLELAARAGYDPRAAITLWKKMSVASGGKTPEFLSTHPSNERRIAELSALIPAVMPLFNGAPKS
jgi:predicted Zn-dependent protease